MRLAATLVAATLMQSADLRVRAIDRGAQSGIEDARQVVINAPEPFAALWREHASRPQPAIDWTHESVVGLFLGTRSTAGYAVELVSASRTVNGSVVRYRELKPPADAMTAQVLTFPFVIVAVPSLTPPVRFESVR